MLGLVLLLLGGICLLVARTFIARRPNAHHRRMRGQADRALPKLRALAATKPQAIIAYVRKMHPHAVEELVLSAAEQAGHRVRRNTRYVGDGGVDGAIEISGTWHLVQTKRYANAINPQHVRDFSNLCRTRGRPGLFIHFGRTGPMSKLACGNEVRIVSGPSLIALISGRPINPPLASERQRFAA